MRSQMPLQYPACLLLNTLPVMMVVDSCAYGSASRKDPFFCKLPWSWCFIKVKEVVKTWPPLTKDKLAREKPNELFNQSLCAVRYGGTHW